MGTRTLLPCAFALHALAVRARPRKHAPPAHAHRLRAQHVLGAMSADCFGVPGGFEELKLFAFAAESGNDRVLEEIIDLERHPAHHAVHTHLARLAHTIAADLPHGTIGCWRLGNRARTALEQIVLPVVRGGSHRAFARISQTSGLYRSACTIWCRMLRCKVHRHTVDGTYADAMLIAAGKRADSKMLELVVDAMVASHQKQDAAFGGQRLAPADVRRRAVRVLTNAIERGTSGPCLEWCSQQAASLADVAILHESERAYYAAAGGSNRATLRHGVCWRPQRLDTYVFLKTAMAGGGWMHAWTSQEGDAALLFNVAFDCACNALTRASTRVSSYFRSALLPVASMRLLQEVLLDIVSSTVRNGWPHASTTVGVVLRALEVSTSSVAAVYIRLRHTHGAPALRSVFFGPKSYALLHTLASCIRTSQLQLAHRLLDMDGPSILACDAASTQKLSCVAIQSLSVRMIVRLHQAGVRYASVPHGLLQRLLSAHPDDAPLLRELADGAPSALGPGATGRCLPGHIWEGVSNRV